MKIQLLVLCFSLTFLPVLPAATDSPPKSSSQGYEILQLVRGRQNHMVLKAEINGKQVLLAVDSGAPISCLSEESADYLKLSAPAPETKVSSNLTIDGKSKKVVWLPQLQVGTMNLGPGPMVVFRDSSLPGVYRKNSNSSVDGLLGWDILRRYQAILNCRTAQLFLKRDPKFSNDFTKTLGRAGYRSTAMTERNGHLFISCQFRGESQQLIVDTGAFVTQLQKGAFLGTKAKLVYSPMRTVNSSGDWSALTVAAPSEHQIIIAGIPVKEPVAVAQKPNGSDCLGFLGCDVLGLQAAIIDFEKMTLYFHEAIDSGKR